jgi:hypothetical protein
MSPCKMHSVIRYSVISLVATIVNTKQARCKKSTFGGQMWEVEVFFIEPFVHFLSLSTNKEFEFPKQIRLGQSQTLGGAKPPLAPPWLRA